MIHRLIVILAVTLAGAVAALAQETAPEMPAQSAPRAATGGAQTLEDILARQAQQTLDDSFRSEALGQDNTRPDVNSPLGTRGGPSDADLWRALRYGRADVSTQARGHAADVLVQDGGMTWLSFREGPLRQYGGYLLLGVLGVLALFYLLRGKIRIDGEKTGRTVLRFAFIERFAHWLLGGAFIVLALTGLLLLFGRVAIIPLFGHEAFGTIAALSKWSHNNLAWPFMLGLIMVIVMWVGHNIPNRHDLKWIAVAGGLFSKNVHPPARKFNAGQKLIFWLVVVLGLSISASGLSLLFPHELSFFAPTFAKLNALGLPQMLGFEALPTDLSPQQEMQLSQAWHAIVAFVFMATILGHIYIGSVGMEGAFDAMGSGDVEEQWAREHHSLWLQEVEAREAARQEEARQ